MTDNTTPMLQLVIKKLSGDMKMIGAILVFIGALSCMTIIGLILGLPTIIMGIRLRESAESFRLYSTTGDTTALEAAFIKQERYFFTQKVIMLGGLLVMFLFVAVVVMFGITVSHMFAPKLV
jgi:hypothetical protein